MSLLKKTKVYICICHRHKQIMSSLQTIHAIIKKTKVYMYMSSPQTNYVIATKKVYIATNNLYSCFF